ncbi:unnamed protein product [Caenorhabditis auriculariae]|uniref:Uncharacterized protein n=1 Tax=Caenorhabditis auriculariae TaxID=2777116 RepID=A0A8S1H6V8_9PELO|nr:unnamed protein product [Caenorhabditis auriculariae]
MGFNLSTVLSVLFLAYMGNNIYTMYQLFNPETCQPSDPGQKCLSPYIEKDAQSLFPLTQLRLYVSPRSDNLGILQGG